MIERRTFLTWAMFTALHSAASRRAWSSAAQTAVPNSTGTESPSLKVPPLACDCHHHIYDPARFPPLAPGVEPDATVSDYRLLQKRIGTTRNVIVTPAPYVTDNRVTLDAITQLGANARGVAVVHPTVTDAELKALDRAGIRGIRFALSVPATTVPATSLEMIEPLANRVTDLGWHIQINMDADQIVAAEAMWMRIPSVIVFDNMAKIPQPTGSNHPAFALIRRLMDKGRVWVKLSVGLILGDGPPQYKERD